MVLLRIPAQKARPLVCISAVAVLIVAVIVVVVFAENQRAMPGISTSRAFADFDGSECHLNESDSSSVHDCHVRIVHISDTHGLHNDITKYLPPAADLMIHTGDFCNDGTAQEFDSFNSWLGQVKSKFRLGIVVVLGNHDYKFLDRLDSSDELISTLASDGKRREYLRNRLPNAVVLDNEVLRVPIGADVSLTLFGSPWNPWQSSPTYVDRVLASGKKVKTDHDRVFQDWSAHIPSERKKNWANGEAWRYDEIPAAVDILLTHVPPFGIFDRQPLFGNWGSSQQLLQQVRQVRPRAVLFGHVHAQRGYWEKVGDGTTTKVTGGVQYATVTDEGEVGKLMEGSEGSGVQFVANSALMSDRTVQPLAKKKIVGPPRLILGRFIRNTGASRSGLHDDSGDTVTAGAWHFHDINTS